MSYTCTVQGKVNRNGLVKDNAGRCLDVWNFDTTNGTPIGAHECHASSNQQWTISAIDYTFRALGKCMTSGPGPNVYINDCNGTTNQQWLYTSGGNLVNFASSNCLESIATSNPEVSTLRVWTCDLDIALTLVTIK